MRHGGFDWIRVTYDGQGALRYFSRSFSISVTILCCELLMISSPFGGLVPVRKEL